MSAADSWSSSPNDGSEASDGNCAVLAALSRRCALEGAQPWLFFRQGWGWRWWSWQRARDRLESNLRAEGNETMETGEAPAESLVRELAGELREWQPGLLADLWQAAAGLEGLLGVAHVQPRSWRAGRSSRRVAVELAELGPHGCHLVRAWSIAVGAALVLPAGADDWSDAVLWSRPTDLWTSARQLEWLQSELTQRRSRPGGLRRLRVVAVDARLERQSLQLAAEVLASTSVELVQMPQLESAASQSVETPPAEGPG